MLLENLIVVNGALELERGALSAEQRQVVRTIAYAINALKLFKPIFYTAQGTRTFASQVEYYINQDVGFGEFDPISGVRLVLESLEKKTG